MGARRSFPLVHLIVLVSLVLAALPSTTARAAGSRLYVKVGGTSNCSSWVAACSLDFALIAAAAPGDQIWVQAGVYTPNPASRSNSIVLQDEVAVYGGFAGNETQLSQRNFKTNVTVLSGDIGAAGDPSDNSYHVVLASTVD